MVSCPDCGAKYRLSTQRLKEGKTGLRCRHCDRIISLRRTQPSRSLKVKVIRTDQPESILSQPRQPVFHTYSGIPKSRNKKIVFLASAAAGLLALVVTAIFFGYPLLFPNISLERIFREPPARTGLTPADGDEQPFAYIDTDLPALQKELAARLPFIMDDPRWRFAAAVLKAAEFQRAKIFLYPDSGSQMLPVLVLQANKAADPPSTLLRRIPVKGILLPAEGNAYRFGPKALEIADGSGFPAASYRIWFHTDWMVCAPKKQSRLWADGNAGWHNYSVARFPESFEQPIRLAGITVRIPEDLPRGWTRSLIPDSTQNSDPVGLQLIDAATDFLVLLDSSMQQIDSMAGVFQFTGETGRSLQYIQRFRQGIDGNPVFTRLQSDNNHQDRTTIGAIFSKLLHHDRLNTSVQFRESQLNIRLEWQAEDDQAMRQAAFDAVFGPNRFEMPHQTSDFSATIDQQP